MVMHNRLWASTGMTRYVYDIRSAIETEGNMLDRIWTLVDKDGDIVRVGPILDFFTSMGAVEVFREQLRTQNPDISISPRFLPAPALFRLVADRGLQVSINRGMEHFGCRTCNQVHAIASWFRGQPPVMVPASL